MDQRNNESIAQFFLMIFSATIAYIVSTNLQSSTTLKILIIIILIFIAFIFYTSLIGRPWPTSYYRFLVCNGTKSDIDSFFWTFYEDFENLLKSNRLKILDLNNKDGFAYLSLENNNLKIEADNIKTLDNTCNFVKEIVETNDIKNIKISKINYQNKVIARLKMNLRFRASTTHMIIATKIKLNETDFKGIYATSKIHEMSREGENASTRFSWPEEKDFLLLKDKSIKNMKDALKSILEMFDSDKIHDYPIIRNRTILLDEYNADLIYSVTIDAKWEIPFYESISLFNDAIKDFNGFLDVWGNIDPEAGVRYRFKDLELIGIRIQDGINAKNYAKRISFISGTSDFAKQSIDYDEI